MASNIKFSVETKLLDNFSIETKCGNHLLRIDQPISGGGNDTGPCPIEYQLVALSGCIATMARIVSMQNGVELNGIKINASGDLDAEGLLGINENIRTGLNEIFLNINLEANLNDLKKKEFVEEILKKCPISDNLENGTNIKFNIE